MTSTSTSTVSPYCTSGCTNVPKWKMTCLPMQLEREVLEKNPLQQELREPQRETLLHREWTGVQREEHQYREWTGVQREDLLPQELRGVLEERLLLQEGRGVLAERLGWREAPWCAGFCSRSCLALWTTASA